MELRRVVVTGQGALTPIGNNTQEYWEGLKNGANGTDWITRFDPEKFKTRFACEVKNFDPAAHFDRRELRKLDPFAQFALVATDEAINDAGFIGGHVIVATNQSLPYYWPNRSSVPVPITMPIDFPYGEIYGINASGQMVGIM